MAQPVISDWYRLEAGFRVQFRMAKRGIVEAMWRPGLPRPDQLGSLTDTYRTALADFVANCPLNEEAS